MGISRGEAESATATARADQLKKTGMAHTKEKYEKQSNKINSWEAKQTKKAKRKLTRAERAVERKKMKARLKFRDRIDCIQQIAKGARSQAKEKQMNEELEVKERANIMRATAKVPSSCF